MSIQMALKDAVKVKERKTEVKQETCRIPKAINPKHFIFACKLHFRD